MKLFVLISVFTLLFSKQYCELKNNEENQYNESITTLNSELDERIEQNRTGLTPIPFSGTYSNVYLNTQVNSYFNYPGEHKYYRYSNSDPIAASLNYSSMVGTAFKIFYYDYYVSNEYLTSKNNLLTSVDCFYFDKNVDYILDFQAINVGSFSFKIEPMTESTTNFKKYVVHQWRVSGTVLQTRYSVEYFDVLENSYTPLPSNIISNASSTNYIDLIGSGYDFYEDQNSTWTDNRRLVENTDCDEYSSIGCIHCGGGYYFSNYFYEHVISDDYPTRGSGTFISEDTFVTAGHLFYQKHKHEENNVEVLDATRISVFGLINPGVNSYADAFDYGMYIVTDVYLPIAYIIYNADATYDWAICRTSKSTAFQSTKIHSCMALSPLGEYEEGFSGTRCAGYPTVRHFPLGEDDLMYETMWTTYPLSGNVIYTNQDEDGHCYITSTDYTSSKGQSGGPLYIKYTFIENGQLRKSCFILGIVHGTAGRTLSNKGTAHFYWCRPLITNISNFIIYNS